MNDIKLNPIYNALDGIDEDIAARVAVKHRKINKPLKIAIISVAAAMLLGTTAAAATLGDHPVVKINNKTITPKFSSYVDDDGWTIKTTAIEYPFDIPGYEPIGEIRGVYNKNSADYFDDTQYYDELGVRIDNISNQFAIYLNADKEGEIGFSSGKGAVFNGYHQHGSGSVDGTEIQIEIWQDPIQAAREAIEKKSFDRMSIDEKIDYYLMYGWDIGYPEHGGFEHPSMRDILSADGLYGGGFYGGDIFNYNGSPSAAAARYYNYTLDQPDGFNEKDGVQVIIFTNDVYDIETHQWLPVEQKITQEMFIYTMTDNTSGKDVKFTVWRSAEEKDVNTDCFKFDYEYIPLNNGTEARLHQSGYSNYIVEFEKDGAAYAAVTYLDRELVDRVLTNMNLL